MKESDYWDFALFVTITIMLILIFRSIQLGLVDVVMQWLGILLAFLLAMIASEAVKIESEERRAELIIDDLIEELRFVQAELEKPESGRLYLATWTSIRGTGFPDRIPHHLRKGLAQALVTVDVYNDSIDRLSNYILEPIIDENNTDMLKETRSYARKHLEVSVMEALTLYDSMKKNRLRIPRK